MEFGGCLQRQTLGCFAGHGWRWLEQPWCECNQSADECNCAEQQHSIIFFTRSHELTTSRRNIGSAVRRSDFEIERSLAYRGDVAALHALLIGFAGL